MRVAILFLVIFTIYISSVLCRPGKKHYDDLETAAGGHGHHGVGRVQIKVYRGQSKHHGHGDGYGHGGYFAPYGYWVRQPPDNHGYHHSHY